MSHTATHEAEHFYENLTKLHKVAPKTQTDGLHCQVLLIILIISVRVQNHQILFL